MGNCCRPTKYVPCRSSQSSQNSDKDRPVVTGCPSSSSNINSPSSLPVPAQSKFRLSDIPESLIPSQIFAGKTNLDPEPPAESEDSWMSAELITTPFKHEAGRRKTRVFIPPLSLDFVQQSAIQVLKQSPTLPWIVSPESASNHRDEVPIMSLSSSSAGPEAGSFHSRLEITGLSAFGVSSEASKDASLLNKTLHAETSRMIGLNTARKRREKSGSEPESAELKNTSLPIISATDVQEQKSDSKFHLKTALLQFDRVSEELTQTHRPVTMTRIKFTGTISVALSQGETRLNEYIVLQQILADEKGTWYSARSDTNQVTIWEYNKTDLSLKPTSKSGTALDALYEQVRLLDRIQHPSILQLLEVIDDPENETGYFVYEDVRQLITATELTETCIKSTFRQLIEAVAYLHDVLDVVHLSIRPEALFLTENADLKLTDFSQARSGKESEDTRRWIGQKITEPLSDGIRNLEGRPPQGKSVDIWDCGNTLFRLLFGKIPFPDVSETASTRISKER